MKGKYIHESFLPQTVPFAFYFINIIYEKRRNALQHFSLKISNNQISDLAGLNVPDFLRKLYIQIH